MHALILTTKSYTKQQWLLLQISVKTVGLILTDRESKVQKPQTTDRRPQNRSLNREEIKPTCEDSIISSRKLNYLFCFFLFALLPSCYAYNISGFLRWYEVLYLKHDLNLDTHKTISVFINFFIL